MNILSVDRIKKIAGARTLLADLSFGVAEGERVGLVGVNGAGKSTLLRLLTGDEEPDDGRIVTRNGLRVVFVRQAPDYDVSHSVREHLTGRLSGERAAAREGEIRAVLNELGVRDWDQPMGALSGGLVKKVSLAEELSREADLIFLDEPTNHLDIDAILWLERFLARTPAAAILVTHDRYFLERITDRIFEIDPPNLHQYTGSYSTYLEKRAEREEQARRAEANARNFLRRELEWLRRQPKARGTKSKARIDRIETVQNRDAHREEAGFAFQVQGARQGKRILEIKGIAKSYGGRELFAGFDYIFQARERIGIVGPNGSGKSTFLNILTGRLEPDTGEVKAGVNTRFGYFDQNSDAFGPAGDRRVLEFIRREAGEHFDMGDERWSAGRVLEYFRFDGRLQSSYIEKLSGGERRRLYLVFTLMSNPNFLVLDEPTHDLDVETLSLLEDFLDGFAGGVLTVSHDRYFMDRVADRLLVFGSEDGAEAAGVARFEGNYSRYLENRRPAKKKDAAEKPAQAEPEPAGGGGPKKK